MLDAGGSAGKRLDFLAQELNREANTLGSKSVDARSLAGCARAQGADRADARAGAEHRMSRPTHAIAIQRACRSGCLFVVTAPSGAGKTSLVNGAARARARHPAVGLVHHARAAPGEGDGVRLPLRRRGDVRGAAGDSGEFLETPTSTATATRHPPRGSRTQVAAGHDVLLEIDWQGAAPGAAS